MWPEKPGIDEARGRMGQEAEPAEGRLAFQPACQVVGQGAPLERRAEDELTGVQDEGLALLRLDQAGEIVLPDRRVDVRVSGVVEDAEQVVEADVDARRLHEVGVERVDAQSPGGDFGPEVAIGEQHRAERIRWGVSLRVDSADVVQWQNISFPS